MTEQDIRAEIAAMQLGDLNQRANELSNWLTGNKKQTFDELMYYLSLHRSLISKMVAGRLEKEPVPIRKPDFYPMSTTAKKRR